VRHHWPFLFLASLLSIAASAATAERPARRLPETVIRDICKKYDGKSAYTVDGETTHIDCGWIEKMAVISRSTPVELYRAVLDHATMLEDLRTAGLPDDLDCGKFEVQVVGDMRAIVCHGELDAAVPYVFLAGASGMILRMETILDYKGGLRAAMRRSVANGEISTYYETFIDLNMDVMLAKLHFTATPIDSVSVVNGKISIVLRASGNF
jgi:hypothetical protein